MTKTTSHVDTSMVINGQKVDLFNLSATPHILDVSSVATSLRNIIRFNGYSGYSVGEHSLVLSYLTENVVTQLLSNAVRQLWVSVDAELKPELLTLLPEIEELRLLTKGNRDAKDFLESEAVSDFVAEVAKIYALNALIHDFGEALTGDIIRPLKQLVPEIAHIEQRIDTQIRHHFNLEGELPILVDLLDKQMATIEAYYLTMCHGKTLINLNDIEQIKLFNQPFDITNTCNMLLNSCTGIESRCHLFKNIDMPLNYQEVFDFLHTALKQECEKNDIPYAQKQSSIDWLKGLQDSAFTSLFVERFCELSSRVPSTQV